MAIGVQVAPPHPVSLRTRRIRAELVLDGHLARASPGEDDQRWRGHRGRRRVRFGLRTGDTCGLRVSPANGLGSRERLVVRVLG